MPVNKQNTKYMLWFDVEQWYEAMLNAECLALGCCGLM